MEGEGQARCERMSWEVRGVLLWVCGTVRRRFAECMSGTAMNVMSGTAMKGTGVSTHMGSGVTGQQRSEVRAEGVF